jgi:hypothetical protein
MLDFPAATNNQSLGHERSSILGVYVFELCIFAARIVLSPPILVTVVVQTDAETDSSKEGNIREGAFLLHRCSFFVYTQKHQCPVLEVRPPGNASDSAKVCLASRQRFIRPGCWKEHFCLWNRSTGNTGSFVVPRLNRLVCRCLPHPIRALRYRTESLFHKEKSIDDDDSLFIIHSSRPYTMLLDKTKDNAGDQVVNVSLGSHCNFATTEDTFYTTPYRRADVEPFTTNCKYNTDTQDYGRLKKGHAQCFGSMTNDPSTSDF